MERRGDGDDPRPGLREASLLETRLTDREVRGAGDADWSRRCGLGIGRVDEGRDVRAGAEDLRNGVLDL
jgi:hypothetical protein